MTKFEETLSAVAAELRRVTGQCARVEYPGFVSFEIAPKVVGNLGVENGTWAADIYPSWSAVARGDDSESWDTELDASVTDAALIVRTLLEGHYPAFFAEGSR